MIRSINKEDRESLVNIIENVDLFTDEEKQVAIELIDESISEVNDYYNTFVKLHKENIIAGYYYIGKRSLTDGVYDLYWIVVDNRYQQHGYGTELLKHAEEYVSKANGRILLAETSSKTSYNKTRSFYLRNNYKELATIKDFYCINDNLIVYGKYLNSEKEL